MSIYCFIAWIIWKRDRVWRPTNANIIWKTFNKISLQWRQLCVWTSFKNQEILHSLLFLWMKRLKRNENHAKTASLSKMCGRRRGNKTFYNCNCKCIYEINIKFYSFFESTIYRVIVKYSTKALIENISIRHLTFKSICKVEMYYIFCVFNKDNECNNLFQSLTLETFLQKINFWKAINIFFFIYDWIYCLIWNIYAKKWLFKICLSYWIHVWNYFHVTRASQLIFNTKRKYQFLKCSKEVKKLNKVICIVFSCSSFCLQNVLR